MQKLTCLLVGLLVCMPLWAEEVDTKQLQVIDLQQARAVEVLKLLEPHLSDQVSVSAQQQRLLLVGPAQELEVLSALVAALDLSQPVYQLHLSAGQLDKVAMQETGRVYRGTRRNQQTRLQLLAGKPARLEQGFWLPVDQVNAWGVGQSYQWLAGGVWVIAEPQGNEVVLAVSTRRLQRQHESSQALDWQATEIETHLRLQPGRWVRVAEQGVSGSSSSGRQASTRSREQVFVCIGQEEHPCPSL